MTGDRSRYNTTSAERSRSRTGDVLMIFLLGAAVVLFFWPLWLLNYRYPIGGGDR